MRRYIKLIALLLLVVFPAWGLLVLAVSVAAAPPADFEAFGARLDILFDKVALPVFGGAVLWQLLRIEERFGARREEDA